VIPTVLGLVPNGIKGNKNNEMNKYQYAPKDYRGRPILTPLGTSYGTKDRIPDGAEEGTKLATLLGIDEGNALGATLG
jgi:hypothetical protein